MQVPVLLNYTHVIFVVILFHSKQSARFKQDSSRMTFKYYTAETLCRKLMALP